MRRSFGKATTPPNFLSLKSGQVEISRSGRRLATIGDNGIFGEMVLAREDTVVLPFISDEEAERSLATHPLKREPRLRMAPPQCKTAAKSVMFQADRHPTGTQTSDREPLI